MAGGRGPRHPNPAKRPPPDLRVPVLIRLTEAEHGALVRYATAEQEAKSVVAAQIVVKCLRAGGYLT